MKTMHILSNSHLDREHRHEFQETRLMMVEMLDDVIRIMETDDSYRYFTLDGQAIVLDDYLEMRPHMRPRLQALIRAGRIQIGPWYSLVDCYAVNPEHHPQPGGGPPGLPGIRRAYAGGVFHLLLRTDGSAAPGVRGLRHP